MNDPSTSEINLYTVFYETFSNLVSTSSHSYAFVLWNTSLFS